MNLSFDKKQANGTGLLTSENNPKNRKISWQIFNKNLKNFFSLPKGIFSVSLFGLFLGASTTMIYSQLGLFLKNELHATEAKITFIDGFVELIAYAVRVFSGIISDYYMNRKFILIIGCVITLCMKPLFGLARSAMMVIFAQSIERIGNGLQAVPRDALIADLSDTNTRAQSFGFCKSFKTFGAFLGTSTAILIMYLSSCNYRLVFFCATIPVVIAILCLSQIKENQGRDFSNSSKDSDKKLENPFKRKYLKSLDMSFWKILALASIFELGHFSESVLPVYACEFIPVSVAGSISLFISLGQVLLCYPIGKLADKYNKRIFIKVCMSFMIISNFLFYTAHMCPYKILAIINIFVASFLWGGQMSSIQGLFLSLISERVDPHLRGTAIGVYYLMVGFAFFIASLIGGHLWTYFGFQYAFFYSIAFSVFSLFIFNSLLPKKVEIA